MKGLLALLVVVCALCVSLTQATSDSNPDLVVVCDALSPRFGCDPKYWNNGNRLQCQNKTQIMAWASKAVKSDCYQFLAGDEENPATTYEAGKLLSIHLRVKCYGMLFRGLLVYAVNENEEKVGDWEVSVAEPTEFRRPWTDPTDECFGALMHSTAEYKPYHSVLYFKTPAAGTGKITFRALIKYGNANTGAFYWPAQDLVLTEAASTEQVPTTIYKLGDVGQSCSDVCSNFDGYNCDEEALVKDPAAFVREFSDEAVCILPVISGCGNQAGTYDAVNQYCYYPGTECAANNRTEISVTCDTELAGVSRFCACSNNIESGSSTLQSTSALIILGMFFVNPRAAVFLLALVGMSSAHNWINTQSRSNGASTFQPFKPAVTDMPHVQVGKGQAFQVEWMTAHGSFTYLAIVHSKNQEYMSAIGKNLLEDYIKLAPASAFTDATKGVFQRLHRKDNETLDNDYSVNPNNPPTKPNFFERFILPTDPLYIPRDKSLRGRVGNVGNPYNNSRVHLVQFKAADLAEDVRCSYRSEKYPWLDAVYKFKHSALQPVRPDVANVFIPGLSGFGRYLVQYYWSGYRDAIDVDYVDYQVTNIYGNPPNETRWKRIDHCLFDEPRAVFEFSEVVTDADWCLRKCAARTGCWGVNLVPLKAPSTAYKFNKPANVPWFYPNIYGTDIYVPWNATQFMVFNTTETARLLNGASENKYMCYTVTPADFTDTTDEYTVSRDPDDPVFYSTCYYLYRGNLFPGYSTATGPSLDKTPWRFYDKCIDCQSKSRNLHTSIGVVPKWTVTDTCVNCDLEPQTVSPPAPKPTGALVEARTRCDGQGGQWGSLKHHTCSTNTSCVIPLWPAGRNDQSATLEECYQLTANNPNCSSTFVWSSNTTFTRKCFCYSKQTCCSSCSRRVDSTTSTYEITSTADPTCAKGVLSADNKSCCSASCGAGKCGTNAGTAQESGFCCATCITRPCSQYGPPCQM